MGVCKLSGSGKQVQFIDDDGNVFVAAKGVVAKLLAGAVDNNLIKLNRMPEGVSPSRFGKSEVWYPPNYVAKGVEGKASQDVFADKNTLKKDENRVLEDTTDW